MVSLAKSLPWETCSGNDSSLIILSVHWSCWCCSAYSVCGSPWWFVFVVLEMLCPQMWTTCAHIDADNILWSWNIMVNTTVPVTLEHIQVVPTHAGMFGTLPGLVGLCWLILNVWWLFYVYVGVSGRISHIILAFWLLQNPLLVLHVSWMSSAHNNILEHVLTAPGHPWFHSDS